MDKQDFLYYLNNYRSLTRDEAVTLAALQKKFPYSQVIRNMVAWGAYHYNLPTKKIQLYLANIYSPDIKALKNIVTAPRIHREKFSESDSVILEHDKQQEEILIDNLPPYSDPEMDRIISELPQELFYLKQAKNDFELKAKEVSEILKKNKTPIRSRVSSKKLKKVTVAKKTRTKKTIKKKKKIVKKTISKKTSVKKKAINKKVKKVATKKLKKKIPTKKIKNKNILAKTKKRVQKKTVKKNKKIVKKIFTEKIAQQEQFKIIDQFINTTPRIEIRKILKNRKAYLIFRQLLIAHTANQFLMKP